MVTLKLFSELFFYQNNGQDEIVVCAWDGTTYILDHSRNMVRYKFEDNVCAFKAGQ